MLFAVGSTLVNCTNSYEVEKPDPQLVELAKYAKQHVPEEHPKVLIISTSFFCRANVVQMFLLALHSSCNLQKVSCFMSLPAFSCVRMHFPTWRKDW